MEPTLDTEIMNKNIAKNLYELMFSLFNYLNFFPKDPVETNSWIFDGANPRVQNTSSWFKVKKNNLP